jgi:ATP-dependent helicase HrpB
MLRNNQTPLPIDIHLEKIVKHTEQNENIILTSPPGTGKTSRVPAALLQNLINKKSDKKIIVLVPRRIAAISSAARICEENNWIMGREVGYTVRFDNKSSAQTQLIFMTEGVFIKKLADGDIWKNLELVVFDEFHERSSQIDLALGVCLEKQILEQNLKMLVMSATLDVTQLQTYLGKSEHIEITTPVFSLEIIKAKKSQRLICDFSFADHLVETLQQALGKSKKDILIFLPGLSEIRFIERALLNKIKNFEIHILHGSIKLEEQRQIVSHNSTGRRIILSTNIAESSITIPSIDCVIDSGLVKKSVTEHKIGFKKLELSRISLFSARQRAGRAARTGAGTCFQLWHELDERSMSEQIQPEIFESDLLEESLTLLSLGIQKPDQFSWLTQPRKSFNQALQQLKDWQLIDDKFNITPKGQLVQKCPLDIERSLLFVELAQAGFFNEACDFLAFIETTNFDKQNEPLDLNKIYLNDLGKRISSQLSRITFWSVKKSVLTFKEQLMSTYFKSFAYKIAKCKEKNMLISSLGRGVELSAYLAAPDLEYYLLFSGRELSSALTKCNFAIGFTNLEFEKYSAQNVKSIIDVAFDVEKNKIYKIEKKVAGFFTISESARTYLNEKDHPDLFLIFFEKHFEDLLTQHEHYKNYITKITFLKKKAAEAQLQEKDFDYLQDFNLTLFQSLQGSVKSIGSFLELNLFEILIYSTPENLRKPLQSLTSYLNLPNGKSVKIDYESEQAPKISARIQDLFGVKTNPTMLNGNLRMTVELLGPNYRPAQVTSQLEKFWTTSYLDVRKELKARYPKHAWPENPLDYIPEKKK